MCSQKRFLNVFAIFIHIQFRQSNTDAGTGRQRKIRSLVVGNAATTNVIHQTGDHKPLQQCQAARRLCASFQLTLISYQQNGTAATAAAAATTRYCRFQAFRSGMKWFSSDTETVHCPSNCHLKPRAT